MSDNPAASAANAQSGPPVPGSDGPDQAPDQASNATSGPEETSGQLGIAVSASRAETAEGQASPRVGDTRQVAGPSQRPRIGDRRPAPHRSGAHAQVRTRQRSSETRQDEQRAPSGGEDAQVALGPIGAWVPSSHAPESESSEGRSGIGLRTLCEDRRSARSEAVRRESTSVTSGSPSLRDAGGAGVGENAGAKPVGRYLMCVHVRPHATQIAVLEGGPSSSTSSRGPRTTRARSTGTSTSAGSRTCFRGWRRHSWTSTLRRTRFCTGATSATTART